MTPRIVVFGGTTEGRKVARILDAINEPYLYCTKTQTKQEIKGEVLVGALDVEAMKRLIQDRGIRLLVDAAHPFAEVLHETILQAARETEVETIRYNRQFETLEESELLRTFPSFQEMDEALRLSIFSSVLALTGVQTIEKLPQSAQEKEIYFRILDTEQSRKIAASTTLPAERVIPMNPTASVEEMCGLVTQTNAQVMLSKESGASGFFETKQLVSQKMNVPLWVVLRKPLSGYTYAVDSERTFLQTMYRVRKTALKIDGHLRSGYTTGSSVTAAAKSAFCALMEKKEHREEVVEIACGEMVHFLTFQNGLLDKEASYVVIKNGGDDADVTHGEEIGCTIRLVKEEGIQFGQGVGVGRVTQPGLQVEVGGPAINPVPRSMIRKTLEECFTTYNYTGGVEVIPFVPKGEELAKKTFNPRVGVVDGISILGTTGKVMAYSVDAFIDAIRRQLEVAESSGRSTVLATSGMRSENRLLSIYNPNDLTAVHFGNFVGKTLELCSSFSFERVVVGLMLGKAVKLAEGNLDTHSRNVQLNTTFLAYIAENLGYSEDILERIKQMKMANELPDFVPFSKEEPLYVELVKRAKQVCRPHLKESIQLDLCLISANHDEILIN